MNDREQYFYYQELVAVNGEEYPWTIGVSSPWVESYEITDTDDGYLITYDTMTSEPAHYVLQEAISLEDGKVSGWRTTAGYMPTATYERAQELQAQIDNGHYPWRFNPQEVARTQLNLPADGEFEDEVYLSGGQYRPNDYNFDAEACVQTFVYPGGGRIKITLSHPLNYSEPSWWAVDSVQTGDNHYMDCSMQGFSYDELPDYVKTALNSLK